MATIEELKASKHWLAPWSHLTKEEKSLIILRAYQRRILCTEDIDNYSRTGTYKQRVNLVFPIVSATCIYYAAPFVMRIQRLRPGQQALQVVGGMLGSWLLFQYVNPLQNKYDQQKLELLWKVYERIGGHLIKLNEVLPRFTTENELNRQLLKQKYQYQSVFTDILYPAENRALPLVDSNLWPSNHKPGKIFH